MNRPPEFYGAMLYLNCLLPTRKENLISFCNRQKLKKTNRMNNHVHRRKDIEMTRKDRPSKGDGAVIYTRVSTPEQTSNTSLSTQEKKCREYCEEQGYTVVEVFPEDSGRSGRNANRPSFQKALDFCRDRKNKNIGHLIVLRFNRYFRNAKGHLILYDELLEKHGVRTESATENCNTDSPLHKQLRAGIAAAAEFESDDISQKAAQGMRESRVLGNLTSNPPLGLKREWLTRTDSRIVLDPERAPYIKKIFEMYDQNKLLSEIVETVNSDGFRTQKGNKLNLNQLLRILKNIKYAGFVPVDEETEPAPAAFDRIIDIDLFNRVQERLKGKARSSPSKYIKDRPEFPLRRYLLCAHCSKPITGSLSTSKSGKKHPYYHCRTKGCAGKGSTRPENLHSIFSMVVSKFELDPSLLSFLEETIRDYSNGSLDRLQKNITAHLTQKNILDARRQKLIDNLLDNTIDQKLYSEQIEITEGRIKRLIELMATEQSDLDLQQKNLDTYGLLFENLQLLWDNAPLNLRGALQMAMFPILEWDRTENTITIKEVSTGLQSVS